MRFERLTACHMGVKLGYDYYHPEWIGVLEMTTVLWLGERSGERPERLLPFRLWPVNTMLDIDTYDHSHLYNDRDVTFFPLLKTYI